MAQTGLAIRAPPVMLCRVQVNQPANSPTMKTKSYNVCSFAELSPKARARAIENMREALGRDWDGEQSIEDAKQVFAFAGFDIDKVYFRGFWSQGDGACFSGSWDAANVNPAEMREYAPVDAELHRIADELAKIATAHPGVSFSVKHRGHYSHEYCTEFDFTFPEPDLSDAGPYALPDDAEWAAQHGMTVERLRSDRANEDSTQDLEKALTELARDAMRWIYKTLETDHEGSTSEAAALDYLNDGPQEFDEDGNADR